MILGDKIVVSIDGEVVALQTSCKVTAKVGSVEVVPLPGSADDDGWAHYEPGQISWTVSNDSFLAIGDKLVKLGVEGTRVAVSVDIWYKTLSGNAVVDSVKVTAQNKAYCKVSLSMTGEGVASFG